MAQQKLSVSIMLKAIKSTNYNKRKMARDLNVNRCTIYVWCDKLIKQGFIDVNGRILKEKV